MAVNVDIHMPNRIPLKCIEVDLDQSKNVVITGLVDVRSPGVLKRTFDAPPTLDRTGPFCVEIYGPPQVTIVGVSVRVSGVMSVGCVRLEVVGQTVPNGDDFAALEGLAARCDGALVFDRETEEE